VFGGAGGTEIVGDTADGDHQRVVGEAAGRGDFAAFVVGGGGGEDFAGGAVDAREGAEAAGEMVPVGLGEVVQLMLGAAHAAGGDGVEQRLPDMGSGAFHQSDTGLAALAERVAQLGGELEAGGPATDNDDFMQCVAGAAGTRRDGSADGLLWCCLLGDRHVVHG
jgi:hypothetical protein